MKTTKRMTYALAVLLLASLLPGLMETDLSAQAGKVGRARALFSDGTEENDGLASPIRIAFGPDGMLLVTDFGRERVFFIDPRTNEIVRSFSVAGKPLGVAFARRSIYVGNQTRASISVYDEDGNWQDEITGESLAPIEMPTDLAVDPASNLLFVLDFNAKAVKFFALNGKPRGRIPASAPDPSLLAMPTAVAVDPQRLEVLVSDYGGTAQDGSTIRPRVQVFDYSGNLKGSISSYASGGMMGGSYRFSRPQGLQADALGQVILTDCYSGEVLILSRDTGAVLKTLGGYGTDPGKMRLPLDLVLDEASKDIFVTNNLLKRIEVFRQGGSY